MFSCRLDAQDETFLTVIDNLLVAYYVYWIYLRDTYPVTHVVCDVNKPMAKAWIPVEEWCKKFGETKIEKLCKRRVAWGKRRKRKAVRILVKIIQDKTERIIRDVKYSKKVFCEICGEIMDRDEVSMERYWIDRNLNTGNFYLCHKCVPMHCNSFINIGLQ